MADARANFSKLVSSASATHERFEVTRNGRREAVLLGADDYDALIETLAILGDSETAAAIKDALNEITRGETSTAEDVREAMIRAGQLAE